jgi:hypothetical protein
MKRIAKSNFEWITAVTVDAVIVLTGLTLIIVAKLTDVPDWPWAYVGFFIAAIGLVGELVLGVARADQMSHHPTNPPRAKT